jgi:hypothetical protein
VLTGLLYRARPDKVFIDLTPAMFLAIHSRLERLIELL